MEFETELTVFVCKHKLSFTEVEAAHLPQPEGKVSKFRTYCDGAASSFMLLKSFGDMCPKQFFSALSGLIVAFSILLFLPILETFLETHTMPRDPMPILIATLDLVAMLFMTVGVILQGTAAIWRYVHFLHNLAHASARLVSIGPRSGTRT
ncbi:MAG: hypothetical protein R3245_07825 [Kiloniellales bacterium]|nr:hypothetical protein [Kiloniellales bacterium]